MDPRPDHRSPRRRVDAAAAVGVEVNPPSRYPLRRASPRPRRPRWRARHVLGVACACLLAASVASAEDRYALIVTGAPGGAAYATTYQKWEQQLTTALRDR